MESDAEAVLQSVEAVRPMNTEERAEVAELIEAMELGFRRRWTDLDPAPGIAFPDDGGVIAQDEAGSWYAVHDGMLVAFRPAGERIEQGKVVNGTVRWESRLLQDLIWLDFGTFLVVVAVAAVLIGVGLGLAVDPLLGAVVGPLLGGGLLALRNWAVRRHNRQVLGMSASK